MENLAVMTIYKYPFEITSRITIALPRWAQILHVDVWGDIPCLWALVNPDNPPVERHFRIYGTGRPIEQDVALNGKYLATFPLGTFVWHLFETTLPT
jgi:hypothetical protein